MEKQSREIIILGAGLAGLTLAYQLNKQGIKSQIIEARDRIGGRIHTITNEGTTLELGATWFAEKHINLIALINELSLNKVEQEYGKYGIYELANNEKQLFELPPQPEATYRLAAGSSSLIQTLADCLDSDQIVLNELVKTISFEGNQFHIKTSNTKFESRYLISTLPPNLLIKQIQFEPKLPNEFFRISSNTHTWMGESIKVGLFSPTPFWLEKGVGTVYSQKGPITELYDHSSENGYALKGFIHDSFVALSKREREKAVRVQLTNLFGEEHMKKGVYVDTAWKQEDKTYANYPQTLAPHQNNGHKLLRESLFNGQFTMAGSETAPTFPGYMDGAVEAANLTAKKVLSDLNSQAKV